MTINELLAEAPMGMGMMVRMGLVTYVPELADRLDEPLVGITIGFADAEPVTITAQRLEGKHGTATDG